MKYHKKYIEAMLDKESHTMKQSTINKLRKQLKQEESDNERKRDT